MDRDPPAYGAAVAAVVVTRSPGAVLDRLLASLDAATTRPVSVVLVDIGSTDGAPERASARDGVALLPIGEHVARAAAVNRGVAGLPREVGWVLAADADVELAPGSLDVLLEAGLRHPRAGVLGPRLQRGDGSVVVSAGAVPRVPDLLRGRRVPLRSAQTGEAGPVGWLAGRCMLVRRTAWDSVDGFDPRHLGPVDEVDLGDRLGRAGWLAVYVPDAEVVVGDRPVVGMLESYGCGLRRFGDDRLSAPARIALAAVHRVRRPAHRSGEWTRVP